MKVLLISLAVLCAIACNVEAQHGGGFPGRVRQPPPPKITWPRFRRDAPEEEPQRPPGQIRPPPPPKITWPRFRRDLPEDEPQRFPRQTQPRKPWPKPNWGRFRRDAPEEQPQGSIRVEGSQPMSGPDRQPTLDLNYQHRIIDNDRTKLDAFGGANLHRGHVSPQAGFDFEHRFKNDIFLHGGGQVQQGPRGRLEPSFGAGVGYRFRREAQPYEEEEEEVY